MVTQSKRVFLQSFLVTIIIFAVGLVLGFAIESNRIDETQLALLNSEISLLDEQIRNQNIKVFNVSCEAATTSMFNFADRIYEEARTLEQYDASSKFTEELEIVHKKYDLLRTMLWTHSIEMSERCPKQYHTVVYLFDYASEDIDLKARQGAVSRVLTDLKEKFGASILLIPIATNLDLESVEMIKTKYGISETPAIIVDETKIITEQITLSELEDIVFEKNNYQRLSGHIYEEADFSDQEKIMLKVNK